MQVPYIWGAPGNPINNQQERYNFIRDSTIIIRFRSYRSSHCSWPDSICELFLIHVFICDQSIWFSSHELSSRSFYLNRIKSALDSVSQDDPTVSSHNAAICQHSTSQRGYGACIAPNILAMSLAEPEPVFERLK